MPSITISAFTAAELTRAAAVKALMVMEGMIKALLVDQLRTVDWTEATDPPAASKLSLSLRVSLCMITGHPVLRPLAQGR